MFHTELLAPQEKKIKRCLFFLLYLHDLNQGPHGTGHFETRDLHLNKLGRGSQGDAIN